MAPPKLKKVKRTAKYYRKNAAARRKKAATDKAFNSSPSQKAKRRQLAKARYKRGIMGKGGKDMSHTKSGKLVPESPSKNRARNRGKK
jgi:hypothetical protein